MEWNGMFLTLRRTLYSLQYDGSVRNSETAVVQFTYGDDGLNPTAMEGADRPVEFSRLLENVTTVAPCIDEEPLSSPGLRAMLDEVTHLGSAPTLLPPFSHPSLTLLSPVHPYTRRTLLSPSHPSTRRTDDASVVQPERQRPHLVRRVGDRP